MSTTGYEITLCIGTKRDEPIALAAGSLGALRQTIIAWAESRVVTSCSADIPEVWSQQRRTIHYVDAAVMCARRTARAAQRRRYVCE